MMRKISVILVMLALVLVGCEKEDMSSDNQAPEELSSPHSNSMTVLGDQLKNPYSVSNMKKAYSNLKASGSGTPDINIETTHYYIRFLPKNEADLDTLKADTNLFLFDHPLDYEIEKEGAYYHDPAIPEDKPTYLYTAVEVEYDLPPVEYEVLAELFLPEETKQDTTQLKSKGGSIQDYLYQLEDEALRITDNLKKAETSNHQPKGKQGGVFRKKKRPKGTLEVWDTEANSCEPVKEVFVRTRRWFKFGKDYTNSKGYYRINKKYRRNPKYKVIFKAKNWKIWKNRLWFGAARYNMGRRSKKGYSKCFYLSSWAWSLATVNNAIYEYRYTHCNTYAINKPPRGLRVWVRNTWNTSGVSGSAAMLRRTWGFYGWHPTSGLNTFFNYVCGLNIVTTAIANLFKFILPDIILKTPNRQSDKNTLALYETTCHELAHASHWTKGRSGYWIKYINYIITYGSRNNPYGNGTGKNAGHCGVGEMWANYFAAVCANDKYSSYSWWSDFEDGEDWYNPGFLRDCENNIGDLNNDEIFDCLTKNTNTIDKMVNQIKGKTNHDSQVDSQYDVYNDWP